MNFKQVFVIVLLIFLIGNTFAIVNTDLLAYYKTDEASGTNVIDYLGYDNNGTTTGTVNRITGILINGVQALGSGTPASANRINTTISRSSQKIQTYSMWFKRNVAGNGFGLMANNSGTTLGVSVIATDAKLYCGVTRTGYGQSAEYSWTADTNVWHQLVCVYNNGVESLYFDGDYKSNKVYSVDSNIINGSTTTLILSDNSSGNWNGQYGLDEIGVWDRALSAGDISDLYNSGTGLTYCGSGYDDEWMSTCTSTSITPIKVDLNVVYAWNHAPAQSWNLDCNNNAFDANNQNSVYSITTGQNTNLVCNIDKTGFVSLTGQSIIFDSNKMLTFYLNDTTAPTTSATGESNVWINANRAVGVTASDAGSGLKIIYLTDSNTTTLTSATSPLNTTIGTDGNHALTYTSKDNNNNWDVNKIIYVPLDKTAPTLGTLTYEGYTIVGTQIWGTGTINIPATDAVSDINATACWYSVNNGSTWESADRNATSCYKSYAIVAGTTPQFIIRVWDKAGNLSTSSASTAYTADNVAPTISITGESNTWLTSDRVVEITASDATSGLALIYLHDSNGTTTTKTTSPLTTTIGTDLNHAIIYRAVDNAGNWDTNQRIYVPIDKTAPTIGQTTLSGFTISGSRISGSGRIYAPTTDATSGVDTTTCEYTVNNGGAWASADSNATGCYKDYAVSVEGTYQFNIREKDKAGLQGTGTATISYNTTDATPPTTTFTSFQVPSTTDQNITLTCLDDNSSGTATGCKSTSYNIDGTGWITTNEPDANKVTYNRGFETNVSLGIDSTTWACSGNWCSKKLDGTLTGGIVSDTNLPIEGSYELASMVVWNGADGNVIVTAQTENVQGKTITLQYKCNYTQCANFGYVDDSNNFIGVSWAQEKASWTTLSYDIPTSPNRLRLAYTQPSSTAGVPYKELHLDDININGVSSNSVSFLHSGTGYHAIQYYSVDNADNNETTKNGNWTTYGHFELNFYDENTSSPLNNVTVDYNGVPATTTGNSYVLPLVGISSGEKTFSITKTGYAPRYYQVNLTDFTDVNINFALLPDTLDENIMFRFYKPDETTAYANIYVQCRNRDTNFVLGRLKSDSTGLLTFNLDQNATRIQFDMNEGENIYNSVTVTLNQPKDEQTLVTIDGNWNYQLTGLASFIDLNVSTPTTIFAIYSNTVSSYSILVGSNSESPAYVSRKYDVQVIGDTSTYTLQPYLFNINDALTTTLYTINAYTNQAIGGITIKIYRTLPVVGKTLIEQTVTDDKGQSLVYLILNQTYQFELNVGTTVIRTETYTISGTSSSIYFKIDPGYDLNTNYSSVSVFPYFSPGRNWLSVNDHNITANIDYGANKNSITVSSVVVACYNDSNLLFQDNFASPTMNFRQTYDFNTVSKKINGVSYDGNYHITCLINLVLSDGNTMTVQQTYNVRTDQPQESIGLSLRPFFGCTVTTDPNIPCPMMIVAALFITMFGVAGIMIESGFTYPEFGGILFLLGLGFFTFFTWIPPILFVIILAITLFVYIALGVRRI